MYLLTFINVPQAPWVNILIWLGLILAVVVVFCIIIICITKTFNFTPRGLLISILKIISNVCPYLSNAKIEETLNTYAVTERLRKNEKKYRKERNKKNGVSNTHK